MTPETSSGWMAYEWVWTCLVNGNIDVAWGGGLSPSGTYYAVIQFVGTYLRQSVTLPASTNYTLQFYARYRPYFQRTGVTVTLGTFNSFYTLTSSWVHYRLSIPMQSKGPTILEFNTTTGHGDVAVELDAVSLTGMTCAIVFSVRVTSYDACTQCEAYLI